MRVPKPLKVLVFTIIVLLLAGAAVLIWRDYWSRRSPNQGLFTRGAIPARMPEGDYQGSVNGYSGSWIGKTFDPSRAAGKNRFKTPQGVDLRYPFKTEVALGVADPIKVIKIDYDIAENPLWLRRILDEIVQVGPDHYLGKVHLRWGPAHFTVGYFELRK